MSSVAFGQNPGTGTFHRFAKSGVAVCIIACAFAAPAHAGTKVAVIDGGDGSPQTPGQYWCTFLNDNGYECTFFPKSGPTGPLDAFSVVIDMSEEWGDPQHSLAAFLNTGKGVITWGWAPYALGINNDPVVQAWVGGNLSMRGTDLYVTTATDPILGDLPPGTALGHCGKFGCEAIDYTAGHGDAKVLARFTSGIGPIALLRNRWEAGRSFYFTDGMFPVGGTGGDGIVMRAVAELSTQIPATSTWGFLVFALGTLTAGSVIVRHRTGWRPSGSKPGNGALPTARNLLLFLVLPFWLVATVDRGSAALAAEVILSASAGETSLRLDNEPPFYSTARAVQNAHLIAVEASTTLIVVWEEIDSNARREPFYAVSLDGTNVDAVRATSYDLRLGFAAFDPAIETPAVPATLLAGGHTGWAHVPFLRRHLPALLAGKPLLPARMLDSGQ